MAQDAISYVKALWSKITNSKQNKQDADEGMRQLDDFLSERDKASGVPERPNLPEPPKYDRIEYDAPSDEDLQKSAEDGLGKFKNDGVKAIENELDALKKQYESQSATAAETLKSKTEALDGTYGAAKKNADNDMLKRGLARSSIAANTKSELEGAQAKATSDAQAAYADEIGRISGEIGGLEGKRTKALDEFNLTYAAKLTENINALKKERDEKAREALKYNNSLSEKEYNQNVDKTMKESDLYGEALSQREKENALSGKNGEGDTKAVYNKMAEVLRGMNAADARGALANNGVFRANLNDYYYYLLYNEFAR